jgi:hypothetical protein
MALASLGERGGHNQMPSRPAAEAALVNDPGSVAKRTHI